MIVKQIYKTENKSQLMIDIPERFRGKKRILVVLDDSVDATSEKMLMMQKAGNDPMFQADIDSVSADFGAIDFETV